MSLTAPVPVAGAQLSVPGGFALRSMSRRCVADFILPRSRQGSSPAGTIMILYTAQSVSLARKTLVLMGMGSFQYRPISSLVFSSVEVCLIAYAACALRNCSFDQFTLNAVIFLPRGRHRLGPRAGWILQARRQRPRGSCIGRWYTSSPLHLRL